MKNQQILFILLSAILFSCSKKDEFHPTYDRKDSCNKVEFTYDDFKINDLELNERAYTNAKTKLKLPTLKDDNNILLYQYDNKLNYHPVAMATYALSILDIYRRTKDSTSLELAIKHSNKLLGISLHVDSTILFPYTFNYNFFDRDEMRSPWYSAMAQGKVLSLFSRLYEITNDKKYLDIASQIYSSFNRFKATHSPWMSCVDKDSSLWLEEYPYEQPSHVLNGMIFAIYGVYDYYMINKTEEVSRLLKAAITTIKKNMHLIRDKNQVSYYCFKYNVKNPNYHPIHIKQFKMLHKISGFLEFKEMADKLVKDTNS